MSMHVFSRSDSSILSFLECQPCNDDDDDDDDDVLIASIDR